MNEQQITKIACVCHEANGAWCDVNGDHSQKPWELAEQWQRDSAVAGVKFAIEHPESTPEDQHEAWARDKRADGWVYGEVKDAGKKTHPCLVPYRDLPEFQRRKDALFRAIVKALAPVE